VRSTGRWDDDAEMRAVCQRVSRARVTVEGSVTGEIGTGMLVLLGVARDDTETEARRLAEKVARLRIFEDDAGKFARSLLDVGGAALAVSQFTLIADSRLQKGTRPDFSKAALRQEAEPLYEVFCEALAAAGVPVQRGVFGARMAVELVNDGPVTIMLDT
jgi:D-tyrosyl-tRNA(Tyr) deacylase